MKNSRMKYIHQCLHHQHWQLTRKETTPSCSSSQLGLLSWWERGGIVNSELKSSTSVSVGPAESAGVVLSLYNLFICTHSTHSPSQSSLYSQINIEDLPLIKFNKFCCCAFSMLILEHQWFQCSGDRAVYRSWNCSLDSLSHSLLSCVLAVTRATAFKYFLQTRSNNNISKSEKVLEK